LSTITPSIIHEVLVQVKTTVDVGMYNQQGEGGYTLFWQVYLYLCRQTGN